MAYWAGDFGCAEPHRANQRAVEVVSDDGIATNHIEDARGDVRDRPAGKYLEINHANAAY